MNYFDWRDAEYPLLGEYGGPGGTNNKFTELIVEFTTYETGTVLKTPPELAERFPVGHRSTSWAMNCFIPATTILTPSDKTIRELLP